MQIELARGDSGAVLREALGDAQPPTPPPPRPSAVQGEGVPLGPSAHFQYSYNNGKGRTGRSQAERFFFLAEG